MRPSRRIPPKNVCDTLKNYLAWWRRNQKTEENPFERFLGEDLPSGGSTPPSQRIAFPAFLDSDAALRQYNRADWDTVDLRIQRFSAVLIEKLRRSGIPMYVHTARRTKEVQEQLFNAGHSKIKGPIAPHTLGGAVDIVHGKFHWQMTDLEWEYIGIIGKMVARQMGLKVDWGGDWSFWDPAHWQLSDWRNGQIGTGKKLIKTPRKIIKDTQNIRMSKTTF